MALTLIKEDGTGKADANSYASVAEGDAYHEGHLYASAWTGATPSTKAAALVMATRLIDAECQFRGMRAHNGRRCNGRGRIAGTRTRSVVWRRRHSGVCRQDVVPGAVVEATCEMARELLIADRTAAPAGEGLTYQKHGVHARRWDRAARSSKITTRATRGRSFHTLPRRCWRSSER